MKTIKKIGKITLNVLFYLFIALALFAIIVSVTSKKDSDGAAIIFGYEMRFVQSDSMGACEQTDVSGYPIKSIPVKSMIFVEVVPEEKQAAQEWYSNLKKGDVLTFRYVYAKQETITHRIVEEPVLNERGGYTIVLEGDNKAGTDFIVGQQVIDTSLEDSPNYVIGKVVGQNYALGLLIYAVKSPVGIVCLIIFPCLIIIIYEVIKIASAIGMSKKEKDAKKLEAETKKLEEAQSELEMLKKRLEMLEAQSAAQSDECAAETEESSEGALPAGDAGQEEATDD